MPSLGVDNLKKNAGLGPVSPQIFLQQAILCPKSYLFINKNLNTALKQHNLHQNNVVKKISLCAAAYARGANKGSRYRLQAIEIKNGLPMT